MSCCPHWVWIRTIQVSDSRVLGPAWRWRCGISGQQRPSWPYACTRGWWVAGLLEEGQAPGCFLLTAHLKDKHDVPACVAEPLEALGRVAAQELPATNTASVWGQPEARQSSGCSLSMN